MSTNDPTILAASRPATAESTTGQFSHSYLAIGHAFRTEAHRDQLVCYSPVTRTKVPITTEQISLWTLFVGGASVDAVWRGAFHQLAKAWSFSQDQAHAFFEETLSLGVANGFLVEETILSPEAVAELRFCNHKVEVLSFLEEENDGIDIPLRRLPHLDFFQNHRDQPHQTHRLDRYVTQLLAHVPDEERPAQKKRLIDQLVGLYQAFATAKDPQAKMNQYPLFVGRRPDGAMAVLNRTTIAAIAQVLGLNMRAQILQTEDFLGEIIAAPEDFFGTLRDNQPYQSIFHDGVELIHGRRPDLYERLGMIRKEDLQGKAILDLGCNIGMNCYLAVELGAARAFGAEYSENLVNVAAGLNGWFGRNCRFRQADLNEPLLFKEPYDTVFMFAVLGHLKSSVGILQTIKNSGAGVVYFETHRRVQYQGDLEAFLNADLFESTEFIDYSFDNSVTNERTRRLYRCVVKRG